MPAAKSKTDKTQSAAIAPKATAVHNAQVPRSLTIRAKLSPRGSKSLPEYLGMRRTRLT